LDQWLNSIHTIWSTWSWNNQRTCEASIRSMSGIPVCLSFHHLLLNNSNPLYCQAGAILWMPVRANMEWAKATVTKWRWSKVLSSCISFLCFAWNAKHYLKFNPLQGDGYGVGFGTCSRRKNPPVTLMLDCALSLHQPMSGCAIIQ
jgi:hypothetical protein